VVDTEGTPLQATVVKAYVFKYDESGQLVPIDVKAAPVDDRGVFRMHLDPGEYGFRVDPPTLQLGESGGTLYYATYYPGVTVPASASTVTLESGAEAVVNLTVTRSRGTTVHLKVGGTTPRAPTTLQVQVRRSGDIFDARVGTLAADRFEEIVGELLPGEYTLQVSQQGRVIGMTEFSIRTADDTVELVMPELSVVSGAVMTLGPNGQFVGTANVQIHLHGRRLPSTLPNGTLLDSTFAVARSDGTFMMANVLPGTYLVGFRGLPTATYIAKVEVDGRELEGSLIEVRGETRIVTTLGADVGLLRGTVRDAMANVVSGATVVLLPEDRRQTHRISTTMADPSGAFEVQAAPGLYHLYVWNEVNGAAYRNPDFMRPYNDRGQTIRIEAGAQLMVEATTLD
jgi:hypothetical protein